MIYTSAGEKTLKIKKDKFISCFKNVLLNFYKQEIFYDTFLHNGSSAAHYI